MDSESKRDILVVLGRKIGTMSGWDRMDTETFCFYDFEPISDIDLPSGDLAVSYGYGTYEVSSTVPPNYDIISRGDIVDLVKDLPWEDHENQ